jgi:hypothetical protein
MSHPTLTDTALAFTRAYRALQELPEAARRIADQAITAGPEDLEALTGILKTLNVPPGLDHAEEQGKDLENRLRSLADRASHEARKAAVLAQYTAAVLAAGKAADPARLPVAAFAPTGARIIARADLPAGKNQIAYAPYRGLPDEHPVRARVRPEDCPTVNGEPVVYLGPPVATMDGGRRPAPDYPLDQAVRWTVQAGRLEKEQAEKEKWDQERRDLEAKEANRKAPTLEQLNAQVQSLLAGYAELRASGVKLSDEHRQEVARLSAHVDQLNAAQAAGNAGGAV